MSQDPFQQGQYQQPPVPGQRPQAGTVFGVICLVFGVLGIVGTCASAFLIFGGSKLQADNPALEIMNRNATYKLYMHVSVGLGLIASLVLIGAGIGLLQLKPFGRQLAIGYSLYGIIAGIAGFLVNVVYVFPPLIEQARNAPAGPAKGGAIGGLVGGMCGGVFALIFPVILLIFMFRPEIVAAYSDRPPDQVQ